MKNKMIISILTAFIFIVILSNFTFLPVIIGLKPLIHVYHYEVIQTDYKFVEYPEKGTHFSSVLSDFEKYKIENNRPDMELCREFRQNWLKFWNWRDYLSHDRWKIKYCK